MKEEKMHIEVTSEQVADLVAAELRSLRTYFINELDEENPCIFSMNENYDKLLIEKHIEAATLLLSWYEA
jgi:hypothetical protein